MVNDGDMYLWRELGINSWPTFALVGPNGRLLAQVAGEGRRKVITHAWSNALIIHLFLFTCGIIVSEPSSGDLHGILCRKEIIVLASVQFWACFTSV